MKKCFCLVMVLTALLVCLSAQAAIGYPAVKEGIDFGGKDIYIYDYWTSADNQWEKWTEMDEDAKKTFDYRKWLEKTYNCKIHQIQNGDWSTCAQVMEDFVAKGGEADKLAFFIVEPGKIGSLITKGVAADWKYDFSADKWNELDKDYTTIGGKTYGAYVGFTEPRSVLYFNKRVLKEAGIDPESIYDAQKDGTWTWDMFEKTLSTITRDTDNDGVIDVWGITGSGDDMNNAFVFNNGGKYFDFDQTGKLMPVMDSEKTKEGLAEAKKIGQNYFYAQPADGNWDYYKEAFKAGNIGFYSYQCYGGLAFGNGSSKNTELADMEDDWGIVAFPVRETGMPYITVSSGCDNITMIPSCYDEKTIQNMAFIYDMWTNDAPGVDSSDDWIGDKYSVTDERAVNETYWMLLNNVKANRVGLLGTQNDVLGSSLLWQWTSEKTPDELIKAGMPEWQALCDKFNSAMPVQPDRDEDPEDRSAELAAFVERNYALILGRDSDEAGKANWTNALKEGTLTGSDLMSGFLNSEEFKAKEFTNDEMVEIMYNVMLDRPSDPDGKAFWIERLNQGMSINAIASGFVGSEEFGKQCEKLGIQRGDYKLTETRDQNLGITSFVNRCYTEGLGRNADTPGMNDWCKSLLDRKLTPQEVAHGFVTSEEMKNKTQKDEEYVTALYHLYLGREPDQEGFQHWVGLLREGTGRESIESGFSKSQEFSEIISGFGLK